MFAKTAATLLMLCILQTGVVQAGKDKAGLRPLAAGKRVLTKIKHRLRLPATSLRKFTTAAGAMALTLQAKAALAIEPSTLERITTTWQTMGPGGKAAVISAAIVVPAAAVGGRVYYKKSRAVADMWTSSEGHKRFARALQSSDPLLLTSLHQESKSALTAAQQLEQSATQGHDKKATKKATLGLAFDGLTHFFIKFKANDVSMDPAKRAGKVTPKQWSQDLHAKTSEAKKAGHEGFLAPRLQELKAELAHQDRLFTQYETAVAGFKKATPRFFAKEMKSDLALVTRTAKSFVNEVKAERALHRKIETKMRARVSDRLAGSSTEFKGKRERFRRLDSLFVNHLEGVKTLAGQIDSDLREIESARSEQTAMLALAATQTRVPVTKQVRTGTDSNNNPTYTTKIEYEDHSGPTRALAMMAASRAESAASSANSRARQLNQKLGALQTNPVLVAEGLARQVRKGTMVASSGTFGAVGTFFLPPMVSLVSNLFDNHSRARSDFAPTKASIDALVNEVGHRRTTVRGWIDHRIDHRIENDIQVAKRGQ